MPEVDPNSWAAIIREVFDGMPKLLGGIKDVVLAVGVLYGAWSSASASGKLDVAASKAEAAAIRTEEVKQALAATTADRDERLTAMQHTDLTTAATIAAVKAELTKDPDDMNTAKMAKTRLEEHKFPAPVTPNQSLSPESEMNVDQWMTLGIWVSGLIFSLVGAFIVREVRRNDRMLEDIQKQLRALDQRGNRHSTSIRLHEMALNSCGLLRNDKFPSPPTIGGDTE